MTTNQRRAAFLAEQVSLGARSPEALSDSEWSLLLLAAGTNAVAAPPAKVCRRVTECANRGSGYFLRGTGCPAQPRATREPQTERRESTVN